MQINKMNNEFNALEAEKSRKYENNNAVSLFPILTYQ
jgi:hypothetical protein